VEYFFFLRIVFILIVVHYQQLAALYKKHKASGFEVLAFPCNQFGGQEPGSNAEIKAFALEKNATFPIFDKVDVKGSNQAPLFNYLCSERPGFLRSTTIKWNFTKVAIHTMISSNI
jgi:glutathione peroxidase